MILTTEQKAQIARLPKSMAATVLAKWEKEFAETGANPWGPEAREKARNAAAYANLQSEGYNVADMDTADAMERD
jgi:hypothetical protein